MTSDIVRLETNLVGVKDDLSITQNKLKDVKGKLKNANKVYDDLRNKVATVREDGSMSRRCVCHRLTPPPFF